MIALNHVLTGTAIGLALRQPLLAAPLALASHFVLDMVPHFVYGKPWGRLFLTSFILDALSTAAALAWLVLSAPQLTVLLLLCGICAELPDVLWLYVNRWPTHWYFVFHKKIQRSETLWGIVPELCYLALIIAVNAALLPR